MEGVLVLMLIVSAGLYALSKICLNSYNIVLSNEQQQTAARLSEVQNSVNVLKADVNELQDRSRVLAMVEEDGINTNQETSTSSETVMSSRRSSYAAETDE